MAFQQGLGKYPELFAADCFVDHEQPVDDHQRIDRLAQALLQPYGADAGLLPEIRHLRLMLQAAQGVEQNSAAASPKQQDQQCGATGTAVSNRFRVTWVGP